MKKHLIILLMVVFVRLSGQKPNIVIIVTDDQSFNSIGYTSKGGVYTPTIDMLAENGMKFTNAHHPVTVCSPSRYSLLTGKFSGRCEGEEYLSRFPPGTLTRTENNCELTMNERHLGNILGNNGYTTGFVGKSHVMEHDILRRNNWSSYGLQEYSQDADPYDPAVDAKMKYNHEVYQQIVRSYGFDYADAIYMGNVKELWNDALNIHNLEWTVDKARTFIEQEQDNPFFLLFSTTLHHGPVPWANNNGNYWSSFDADPHLTGEGVVEKPWDFMPERQEIQDEYVNAGYPERDAYALLLDKGVKAIHDKLAELNLEENTLVIFMPDHGMWRHGKATLHDYGLKVPMFMYWKGTITAGTIYDGLIQTVDFVPTLLDIAGIPQPDGYETDGISLKSIIETGSGEAHSSLFGELGYSRSVKTKEWKYIAIRYPENVQNKIDNGETFNGWQEEILDYPYLTRNSHLGHYAAKNNPHYFELDQLYDLNADSAETVNVIDQHPDVVADMRAQLSTYLRSFENRPFGEFTLSGSDPPFRAHTPVPVNGATRVSQGKTIRWTSEYKADSHDVYFGTTNPPEFKGNQVSTEFDPGDLEGNTTYYWRIDEKNENGTTTGDTWSFTTGTTEAAPAENPYPDQGAGHVRKTTELTWDASANAAYYQVYLGTGNPQHVADVTEPRYDPGILKSNTIYLWRVDAVNADDVVTLGAPWYFTTGYGNIAPEASVAVSGTAGPDFSGDNVNDGVYKVGNIGEWRSGDEAEPWVELTWPGPVVVDRINLYDLVGTSNHLLNGTITFSNGTDMETGSLPDDGSKKELQFAPREITSLKLDITSATGVSGLAEIEVFDTVMYASSVLEDPGNDPFRIYPNPVRGNQVSLSGLAAGAENHISIFNIEGRQVAAFETLKTEIVLNLDGYRPGIYLVELKNRFNTRTRKIIIG